MPAKVFGQYNAAHVRVSGKANAHKVEDFALRPVRPRPHRSESGHFVAFVEDVGDLGLTIVTTEMAGSEERVVKRLNYNADGNLASSKVLGKFPIAGSLIIRKIDDGHIAALHLNDELVITSYGNAGTGKEILKSNRAAVGMDMAADDVTDFAIDGDNNLYLLIRGAVAGTSLSIDNSLSKIGLAK